MTKNKLFKLVLLTIFVTITFIFFNRRNKNISIEPLIKYAKNLQPCQEQLNDTAKWILFCDTPPLPSEDVINVLNNRVIDSTYRKWVLIVYLKLFQDQFRLYHQSFECRSSPFIIKRFTKNETFNRAFCEVIGETYIGKKIGPEFLSASSAYQYIEENKLFINDLEVQREMSLIDSLVNR